MTKEALGFHVLLGEFAIGNADRHAEILKILLTRIEHLEQFVHLQQVASQLAEGDKKQEMLSGLAVLSQKLSRTATLDSEIRDFFARAESQREKHEAILRDLRERYDRAA
jgi:hypothetical protein